MRRLPAPLAIVALAGAACSHDTSSPPGPAPAKHEVALVDMVDVPGGDFLGRAMPCNEDDELEGLLHDRPIPKQRIRGAAFRIDRFVASCEQFLACVAEGHCVGTLEEVCDPVGLAPHATDVASVRWEQADAYCRWRGAQLPSYVQWQRAIRGTDGAIFADGKTSRPSSCNAAFTDGQRCLHANELGVEYATRDPHGGEWTRDLPCTGHFDPKGHLQTNLEGDRLDTIVTLRVGSRIRCVTAATR